MDAKPKPKDSDESKSGRKKNLYYFCSYVFAFISMGSDFPLSFLERLLLKNSKTFPSCSQMGEKNLLPPELG